MAVSLDVPETQIALYCPDDRQFYWHHRILLAPLGAGRWVAVGPDLEIEVHDLSEMRHVILRRSTAFPRTVLPIYYFDPVPAATYAYLKRDASLQAVLLGGAGGRPSGSARRLVLQ